MTLRSIGLLAVAVMMALASRASADNWPQWRGPGRDGISEEKGFQTTFPPGGPKIAWKASIGRGYSSFSVVDGKVYTQGTISGKDAVYCFDAVTGKELWKYQAKENIFKEPSATPTVEGKRVFVLTRGGGVFCLDAENGQAIWTKDAQKDYGGRRPEHGYSGSPLVLGKFVMFDVGPNVAVDQATGEIQWKTGSGSPSYGSPVAFKSGDKTLLALFKASGLVLIDANGGSSIASFDWRTTYDVNAATPIIADGGIFISSGYGHGCSFVKFSNGSLSKAYENKEMQNQYSSSVLYNGHIYGLSDNKELRCLELDTGKVKWKEKGFGPGGLVIADGKLIIMADKGTLAIGEAKPEGFKATASAQILEDECWTAPVLSAGRIFCRNTKGSVICVDVGGK